MAEAPVMKTFPINSKIEPNAVNKPNCIGFDSKSFIESMHDTQKFLD